MYKLAKDPLTQVQNQVIRTSDGACIPFDPQNSDYQAYLKWIEDGNTPLSAESN